MSSIAQAYVNDEYVSIYVSLPEQEQIVFYWSFSTQSQFIIPRQRITRKKMENCEITHYNHLGCVVYVDKKRAEFAWYEYDNKEPPQHRGKLVNFAEWFYDEGFHHQSYTHEYRPPIYSEYYPEPQPYEAEEEE